MSCYLFKISRRLLKHSIMINDVKKRSEMMRRRKHGLFKKAYELGKLCDADVAVIVRKNGRFYTYRSTGEESWPPSMAQIVSSIPFFTWHMLIEIANCVSTAGKHASQTYRSSKSEVLYKEKYIVSQYSNWLDGIPAAGVVYEIRLCLFKNVLVKDSFFFSL